MIRESLRSYDSYKLDNGETRERSFDDFEPDDEIELPLTCQTCGKEYWWSEDGATLGYCPKCNGTASCEGDRMANATSIERRSHKRREADRNFGLALAMAITMTFLTGVALGYYFGACEAAGIVLGAK